MASTDWDKYGTGNYEKCADCMVHSGYEATAVVEAIRHPLKMIRTSITGPRTEGAMAQEIPLDNQRKADLTIFSRHVEEKMESLRAEAAPKVRVTRSKSPEAFGTAD
jgi:hypothetical protein